MTNEELTACLLYLRPGAAFGTSGGDLSATEWKDPRPMPTQEEVDAALPAVQAQLLAEDEAAAAAAANKVTLEERAETALATNKTYIGRATPTAAQTTAQVKALSQQNNAIIRLLLDKLDATD